MKFPVLKCLLLSLPLVLSATPVLAQGCVVSRLSTPVFGEQSPYLKPHHIWLSTGYQGFRATYPNWNGNHRVP